MPSLGLEQDKVNLESSPVPERSACLCCHELKCYYVFNFTCLQGGVDQKMPLVVSRINPESPVSKHVPLLPMFVFPKSIRFLCQCLVFLLPAAERVCTCMHVDGKNEVRVLQNLAAQCGPQSCSTSITW